MSFIVTLKTYYHSSNIVCIGAQWNLLGQVGGYSGVGIFTERSIKTGSGIIFLCYVKDGLAESGSCVYSMSRLSYITVYFY